jgi:hypothetical protein
VIRSPREGPHAVDAGPRRPGGRATQGDEERDGGPRASREANRLAPRAMDAIKPSRPAAERLGSHAMRSLFRSLAPLLLVLGFGCSWVDADQCWPNTSGGLGGGGTIPIGAGVGATSGDYLSPPGSSPLGYPATYNPCVTPSNSEGAGGGADQASNPCTNGTGNVDSPPPECFIAPQGPCNEKCYSDYVDASVACGKIADASQRRACQDGAYTTYKHCRESCSQADPWRKQCEDEAEACESECAKLPPDDKKGRQKCWEGCNNDYAKCVKKCK